MEQAKKPKTRPPLLRSVTAGFLGIIALWAVVSAITGLWANRLLTDSKRFAVTVTAVTTQPEVQKAISDKIAGVIVDQAPRADLSAKLLPQGGAGLSEQQVTAQLTTTVQTTVKQVTAAPAFTSLWQQSVTSAHAQLLTQLQNNSTQTGKVNLRPLIDGVLTQLSTTNLSFINAKDMKIPQDAGVIEIPAAQFVKMRTAYNGLKEAWLITVGVAIVATAAMILVSPRRLRSIRNLALSVALAMLLIAFLIGIVPKQVPHYIKSGDPEIIQSATAALQTVTAELLKMSIIVAVLASLIVIGVFAWQLYNQKKALPHTIDDSSEPDPAVPASETELSEENKHTKEPSV